MDYRFELAVPVRYRDLDTYGHVNNVVYGTYCEQGRAAYADEVMDVPLSEFSAVVASLDMDFHRSVTGMGSVTVAVTVPELGTSSFPMHYEIRQDGDTYCTAESTQVVVDPETRESQPIPDSWREAVTDFEGLDE